ncbi:MAG: hypothetical protein R3B90_14140 [Planctomycetaceae bacterium]
MILTGNEIQRRLGEDIVIEPFNAAQLNPNSYNLRLHNELLVYEEIVLDMRRPNRFRRYEIRRMALSCIRTSCTWAERSSEPRRTISCR